MFTSVLTVKQARFVDEFLVDANGAAAAVRAGYAPGSAKVAASRMLTKDNPVRRAIQARQASDSERMGVTRDRVINALLEAFEVAKTNREPASMVRAAVEIGKMLGFSQPTRVEVDVFGGVTAKRFEAMSDAELIAIIEVQNGATEA